MENQVCQDLTGVAEFEASSELSEGHSEQGEGNRFVNNSSISSVSFYLFRKQIILVYMKTL